MKKILVIGLGSMGKRRIRNLRTLGVIEVAGMDLREDRRSETAAKYSVPTFGDIEQALRDFTPTACVISTPPDRHMDYAYLARERGLPCFIEASVVDAERVLELHRLTAEAGPLMVPSCTMSYFPAPRKIKELIRGNVIGRVLNINYQTGQYLRDWHPWESIEDFYVSRRAVGGCREIVPFELTWLNDIFGEPEPIACWKDRIGDMKVDIDDIYHFWVRYPEKILASITVEVLSRPQATREMRILGTAGQIVFSAHENVVRLSTTSSPEWTRYELERGNAEAGYINPEEPYISEMRDFLTAVDKRDPTLFPNSLIKDYQVLHLLNALESRGV